LFGVGEAETGVSTLCSGAVGVRGVVAGSSTVCSGEVCATAGTLSPGVEGCGAAQGVLSRISRSERFGCTRW
jgi:hypothetical protein